MLLPGFLSNFFDKRIQSHWMSRANRVGKMTAANLRNSRTVARELSKELSRFDRAAARQLALESSGCGFPSLPASTDWQHRPAPWSVETNPSGMAPVRSGSLFGSDISVFHDCRNHSVSIRQVRNKQETNLAPFGVKLEVYAFDGSFLSLVVEAPGGVMKGLSKKHIIRLETHLERERDIGVSCRLNLKNGPNTEQVNIDLPRKSGKQVCEFDLAYVPFDESKAEKIWVDLFLDSPPMNQITLYDLTLSRHRRAEI